MGINEFRAYALRTMCEEHLWGFGEEDVFTLKGYEYRIRLESDGRFSLSVHLPKNKEWSKPYYFPTMGRLFCHIFERNLLSYN